ncbi:hypothetical protein EN829_051875 [Mesorhizobium sp. M00.F.Ca.ET.186.01.1.1]|nr:hypothetical protein EN829_051875 [Mesorhizobium sp. M00.F.Ca.ET.186.01.1.1]
MKYDFNSHKEGVPPAAIRTPTPFCNASSYYTTREDLKLMALQPQAGVSKQVQNKALIASLMGSSIEW